MYKKSLVVMMCALAFAMPSAKADLMRDYYSEPGIQEYKSLDSQYINESVDTFGGTLQLHFKDVIVPGNGGLDIVVQRSFKSHQRNLMYPQFMGLGWTMHFGRVTVPALYKDRVCLQRQLYSVSTKDNPSLEFQDGAAELLVLDDYSPASNRYLITKSNWRAVCRSQGDGFDISAPDGRVFTMNKQFNGEGQAAAWYTSRIVDKNGNSLDFTYGEESTPAGPRSFLQRIDASDGRYVTFEYANGHLSTIHVNGTLSASYNYQATVGSDEWAITAYDLTSVVLPENQRWEYSYYPRQTDEYGNPEPNSNQLASVNYPSGAMASYEYQKIAFDLTESMNETHAVSRRTLTSPASQTANWYYQFIPGGVDQSTDKTIVTGPESITHHQHYGLAYVRNAIEAGWMVGLPFKKEVFNTDNVLLEKTVFGYRKRVISDENFWHGRDIPAVDEYVYAASLNYQHIEREEQGTTTYHSDFDEFGQARFIRKSSTANTTPIWHETTISYLNDVSKWIIGLSEIIQEKAETNERTTTNTYNSARNLIRQDINGVITSNTYHSDGEIASITDPRNKTTSFSNYHRGAPRRIDNPDGTYKTFVVDDLGRVIQVTDERQKQKEFSYDGIGRLKGIIFPEGAPVDISYGVRDKTLQRGAYTEVIDTDGWGRVTSISRNGIVTSTRYDLEGRKIFESYPGSTTGISYEYDALGRLVRETHQDGHIRLDHSGSITTITNERGHVRELLHQAYGAFEGQKLTQVVELNVTGDTPGNHVFVVEEDGFGNPVSTRQGVSFVDFNYRYYGYDSRLYLQTETNPETGVTTYQRDAAGNVISKTVNGLNPITYEYDDVGRLVKIDYPDQVDQLQTIMPSEDVVYDHDAVGNIIYSQKGGIVREFEFSDNGNLKKDITKVDGHVFTTEYLYTDLDHIDGVIYPSGRAINFGVDSLGRATQVGNFVSTIAYHPSGQVSSMTYQNGVTTQLALNARRQIENVHTYGLQGDILNIGYSYDPTLNITSIADALSPSQSKAFSYDELGRLIGADTSAGITAYGYNHVDGLIRMQSSSATTVQSFQNGKILSSGGRSFDHDALGNIIWHGFIVGGGSTDVIDPHEFKFDQSGVLKKAETNKVGEVFLWKKEWDYDAGGMRLVSRNMDGTKTYYIYNKESQLLGEYRGAALSAKETIYLGDHAVATVKDNDAPINVNAGADVSEISGRTVSLSASATDPEAKPLSFTWQQVAGTLAQTSASAVALQIVLPVVAAQEDLVFRLTATDEKGAFASDDVTVTVLPLPIDMPPQANPGSSKSVMEGYEFALDGSASTDAEGAVAYFWEDKTVNPAYRLRIYNPTLAVQQLNAPMVSADGNSTVTLTVTDSAGQTDSESIQVTIKEEGTDGDGDGLPDGWELFFFGNLAASASGDPDGDGLSNQQEYNEKTNPSVAQAAPVVVSALTVLPGSTSVFVKWGEARSVAKYSVYWSNTPAFDVTLASKIEVTTNQAVITGLQNGTTYYFKVTASNGTGASPVSPEISAYVASRAWNTVTSNARYSKNALGQKVVVQRESDNQYYLKVYEASGDLIRTARVYPTSSSQQVNSPLVAMDDVGNVGIVWWEGSDLVGAMYPAKMSGALSIEMSCYPCNDYQGNSYSFVGDLKITPDQKGNFLASWIEEIRPPQGNRYRKVVGYKLTSRYYPQPINALDSDMNGAVSATYDSFSKHEVRTTSSGKIAVAWARSKSSGSVLRVAEIDLAMNGFQQILDVATSVNSGDKYIDLSSNQERIGVYWVSGTTFYGRDWSVANRTWGAAYPFPKGGLATPQGIVGASSSHLMETMVYTSTKNSVTTLYANSRTSTGAWGASATTLGTSFVGIRSVALPNGEHVVVGHDQTGALSAAIRSASGIWGAWSVVLAGSSVSAIEAVQFDKVSNASVIWTDGSGNRRLSEFKPGVYVPDFTAPVTTIATTRRTLKGKVFMDCVLTPNETSTTYFRITGAGTVTAGGAATTAWQTYTGQITVQLTGTATIEYYSVDSAGNTEVTKSEVLQ